MPTFAPRHITESQQFDLPLLTRLFERADTFDHGGGTSKRTLDGKNILLHFNQPSTRTSQSFKMAAHGLGAYSELVHGEFSSVVKGESLRDTGQVYARLGYDAIVLRHPNPSAAEDMALYTNIPVINAGCGGHDGQHPSQALLDTYTIYKKRGSIDGIHIAMIGDLKQGRTVRSLTYLLAKFSDVRITFVSPEQLRIEPDITAYLERHRVRYSETDSLEKILDADVLYVTRLQSEWIEDKQTISSLRALQGRYSINASLVKRLRGDCIIMHPLPRNEELCTSVDVLPQAAYFDQVTYGVWVRKALFEYVFRIIE